MACSTVVPGTTLTALPSIVTSTVVCDFAGAGVIMVRPQSETDVMLTRRRPDNCCAGRVCRLVVVRRPARRLLHHIPLVAAAERYGSSSSGKNRRRLSIGAGIIPPSAQSEPNFIVSQNSSSSCSFGRRSRRRSAPLCPSSGRTVRCRAPSRCDTGNTCRNSRSRRTPSGRGRS